MRNYTVQAGDTLSAIAQRFGASVQDIARANGISNPDRIFAGQTLQVPNGASDETIPNTMGNQQVIPVIDGRLNGQGQVIVEEAQRAGLDLALACALVEQESGGRNIFGCDSGDVGDQPPYCHQAVTPERVQALIASPHMNGVGLTQLTWYTFVEEAEALGGAHLPRNQCRVGFRILKDLLDKYSYLEALAAYNGGEGENQHSDQAIAYAAQLAGRHDSWKALLGDLEVLPDTPGGVEPEYEEVTLRVGDQGWLYRANTDPIEWAQVPDLADKELTTDSRGWIRVKGVWAPDEKKPAAPATLEENIRRVTAYNRRLVEADIPYFIWREGMYINIDGPPAYAVDLPAPDPSDIVAIFCAGVGNVDRRLLGLPVPKNNGERGYDGGTLAWEQNYWDESIWFDLDQAEEGDIAFQRWGGSEGAQGHWAYCTGGADDPVIQSYPDTFVGKIVEPGMSAQWTLRQSHNGHFYDVLIKARQWLSPE